MQTRKLTFLFLLLLSCAIAKAQERAIKGLIKGLQQGQAPVINLLNATDSSFIKATVPEQNGSFEFNYIKDGKYLISVTDMVFEKYFSAVIDLTPDEPAVTVPDIILHPASNELKTVQVSAAKPFIQKKADKVVVNPDALPTNAGTTLLDVLEKSPGVLVDMNGNISLKGRQGVIVYIDDKPTYLSAADLANYLRSLPASAADYLELMTNPPAKYEAAGSAGIINIRLKKTTVKGFNGAVNLSFGYGTYMRSNNSVNFNYRINKVNVFANVGWGENDSYQDLTINRYYYTPGGDYNSSFTQNSYIKMKNGSTNARIGADYYLSPKSTLGAVLSYSVSPQKKYITNTARITDSVNQPVSLISSYSSSERTWYNTNINLNYTYNIDNKGKSLTANADYITYTSDHDQSLENRTFQPDYTPTGNSLLKSSLPSDISIQSVKLDYAHPLTTTAKIEGGIKTSLVQTDNIASFYDVINNTEVPNYDFSNHFTYRENINAAYVNYAKDWSKLSFQLGLRLENTNVKGHQLGNPNVPDSNFTIQYTNLFPTLYLSYQLDSLQKHVLGFSFGRRIDRPNYQDLNPFTYPIDRYTYYGGNPFLQPTYAYNFELSYTYNKYVTAAFEFSINNNLIQETNEQRANVYYSRPGNFGKELVYGFSVNGARNITKWWVLQLYTECKNFTFNTSIYGQPLNASRWYWYIGPVNQFIINKKLSAELSGSYQTRILVGQFLTIPVWQARAGVAYKILKGNGAIKLNLTDVFFTNQPGGDINNIANARANWKSKLDSRVVMLSFSYRFNKGKSLNARQSGAADTEKGRVKTN